MAPSLEIFRLDVVARRALLVVVAVAVMATALRPDGAVAQEPAPAFAAGGLSDLGPGISGSARKPAAADTTTGKAAAKPVKPQAKATAAQKAAVTAARPTATYAPAGMMQRGPIIVHPPAARPAAGAAAAAGIATAAIAPAAPPASAARAPGDCLAVNQIGPGTYQIENSGCRNTPVLATIEIRNNGRSITCYIARIRDAYAVTSPPGSPPRINHQCRDGAPGCAEPALRSMFPECKGSV